MVDLHVYPFAPRLPFVIAQSPVLCTATVDARAAGLARLTGQEEPTSAARSVMVILVSVLVNLCS